MADKRKPDREGEFLYFDPTEHPSLSMDAPPPAARPPLSFPDPDAAVRVPALSPLAMRPGADVAPAPRREPAREGRAMSFDPAEHPAMALPARGDAPKRQPRRERATPGSQPSAAAVAAMVERENRKMRQEREAAIIERAAIEAAREALRKYMPAGELPALTKRQHFTPRQDREYERFKSRPKQRRG